MLKRGFVVYAALIWVVLITGPAAATASVVGKWSINGPCAVHASITGSAPIDMTVQVRDRFTFNSNGRFSMIGMTGTWRQKSGRFVIYLNAAKMESVVESLLAVQGIAAELDIQTLAFKGRQVGSAINGSLVLKADVYASYQGQRKGTVSLSISFTGKRISARASAPVTPLNEKHLHEVFEEDLAHMIAGAASMLDTAGEEHPE